MRHFLALISLACACMAHYGAQNLPLSKMPSPKPSISRPRSYAYPLGEHPSVTGFGIDNAYVGSSSSLDELISNLPYDSLAELGSDHSNGELQNSLAGEDSGNSYHLSSHSLGGLDSDNVESINSLTGWDSDHGCLGTQNSHDQFGYSNTIASDSDESLDSQATGSELEHQGPLGLGVPSYYQALKDFDLGMRDVNTNLNINQHAHKKDPRHQYVIIANVVSDLAMNVAQREGLDPSWYDEKYMFAVIEFMRDANKHPSDVVRKIRCLLDKTNHAIAEIRNLMASRWVNYVCRGTKMCDVLIHAAVKMGNYTLKKEAETLLALGKASSLYLNEYAEKFKKGSGNLVLSLLSSRDMLRPLVNADAAARKLVFPDEFKCNTAFGVSNCASTTCLLGTPTSDASGASYDEFLRTSTTATGPDPDSSEYADPIRKQQAREQERSKMGGFGCN